MIDISNNIVGIGVDIENISRFRGLTIEKDAPFLNKIFTEKELDYCFSSADPAQHLAARYAGKEAVIKASGTLDRVNLSYKEIEIVNDDRGIPGVCIRKKGVNNLKILISLSHSQETAIAFTIVALSAEAQQ
jgi:holo-[acyl-carrier protein] synthase